MSGLQQRYEAHKPKMLTHCFFGGEAFIFDGDPEDGLYAEEVGEFWSDELNDSVLAHPDCTPRGITAILEGADPDWKMA
jgi:hypothetical protein